MPDAHDAKHLADQVKTLEKKVATLTAKPSTDSEFKYQSVIAQQNKELRLLRKQLAKQQNDYGIIQAVVQEMESLIPPLPAPKRWVDNRPKKSKIEEHLVLHLSDEHADEVILPEQVGGLEEFNFKVAVCRAETLVNTALQWSLTTLANHRFPVLHVLAYGDHTSGEIHGAVTRSEYGNIFKNCLAIGQLHGCILHELSAYFPRVVVYYVPGNHGRRTQKKDFHGAKDNWDYLIAEFARMYCRQMENVEFVIPDSFSINVDINGWGFGIQHGDGVKSWMGVPWYGIERQTRRLVSLHNSFDQKISYFVYGHFHSLGSIADLRGETIINGAWPATNPYSYESFAGYREPMQLLHGVHPDRGISWRLPIKLKDSEYEKRGPQRYDIEV